MLKYKILLILFVISLLASAMLAFMPSDTVCNAQDTCNSVQLSKQAETFGIKNCHYGIIIFLFLTALTFSEIKNPKKFKRFVIDTGVILGFLIAIYFIYIMIFVLNSYCQYCLAVDVSMILGFLTLLIYHRRNKTWLKEH